MPRTQMDHLVGKIRAQNSPAWAPLMGITEKWDILYIRKTLLLYCLRCLMNCTTHHIHAVIDRNFYNIKISHFTCVMTIHSLFECNV
jgi:hypothetical protein